MKKKLIIFDFDGVLYPVDKTLIYEGYIYWIDEFLGKTGAHKKFFVTEEDFLDWYSFNIPENLKRVGCVDQKDVEKAYDDFYKITISKGGRKQLFSWVKASIPIIHKKYELAILTANSHNSPIKILDSLCVYFSIILGREDADIKPSPAGIHLILKKLNIKYSDAVIIGDTVVDFEAGRVAGIKTGVVKWGFGDWNHLLSLNPDYKFETPNDLLSL